MGGTHLISGVMFRVAPSSFKRRRKGVGVVDAELELGGPRVGFFDPFSAGPPRQHRSANP
jgi:hypothetical protein